jgi:hypothetical protein
MLNFIKNSGWWFVKVLLFFAVVLSTIAISVGTVLLGARFGAKSFGEAFAIFCVFGAFVGSIVKGVRNEWYVFAVGGLWVGIELLGEKIGMKLGDKSFHDAVGIFTVVGVFVCVVCSGARNLWKKAGEKVEELKGEFKKHEEPEELEKSYSECAK